MIAADQPTIFPKKVVVAVSSVKDGSMKDGVELLTPEAIRNREVFLKKFDMPVERAAVFYADFSTEDFCHYAEATGGLMPGVDGASTRRARQPILLPIADCVATVLYDPVQSALMVSHLGRHSTEQFGGNRSVERMTQQYNSDPASLLVWLGPSPNNTDYPLWAFDNKSFSAVLSQQLLSAGVQPQNIEVSSVDTATNANYFSHSQFLKDNQAIDGRYAIVAMMK